jgi:predicted RNase H-like HicB family nuclease
MKKKSRQALTLTGVVVQDKATKGYTGYMLEIPEVIAEGNTREEVENALFENLKAVIEFRREDSENEMKANGDYSTKSFELELS